MHQPLSKTISKANRMIEMKKTVGTSLISHERSRQLFDEGWTPEHDDQHTNGELAKAAICYITGSITVCGHKVWPEEWDEKHFKPGDTIRCLTKAGALIAAEIDRLHRSRKNENSIALCLHSIIAMKFSESAISMDDIINKLKVDFDDATIEAAIAKFKERINDIP